MFDWLALKGLLLWKATVLYHIASRVDLIVVKKFKLKMSIYIKENITFSTPRLHSFYVCNEELYFKTTLNAIARNNGLWQREVIWGPCMFFNKVSTI